MRVYVATSWKNPRYAEICKIIRDAGHEVLDWSSTDVAVPDFRKLDARFETATREAAWTPELAREMLARNEVLVACDRDLDMISSADLLVLLTPCGRNAHFEAGFAIAAGIPCAVLMAPGVEPELMTASMPTLCNDAELLTWLSGGWLTNLAQRSSAKHLRRLASGEKASSLGPTTPARSLHIGPRRICIVCDRCDQTLNVGGRISWPSIEEAVAAALTAGWVGNATWTFCHECRPKANEV